MKPSKIRANKHVVFVAPKSKILRDFRAIKNEVFESRRKSKPTNTKCLWPSEIRRISGACKKSLIFYGYGAMLRKHRKSLIFEGPKIEDFVGFCGIFGQSKAKLLKVKDYLFW
ncbi:MAG: hypothetical protein PQ968_02675 [Methanobacterium sp.]